MKRIAIVLAVMLLFSQTLHAQPDARGLKRIMESQAGKRWAICIGINNYSDRKLNSLKKAANDAYGLGAIFEQQGDFKTAVFSDVDENGQVKQLNDKFLPTKRGIEDYLKQIETFQDIKSNDLVVFSFSGHGISDINGMNFLLPSDWQNDRPYESAIPLKAITEWFHTLGVTKSLLLVDACREEMSSSRSLDSMSRLYTDKFESAQVAAVFFATKQGGFSYEDPNSDYGAFTRFLIDGLSGGGDADSDGLVTFRELSGYVEDGLGDWARNNNYMQRPFTRILGERSGDLALTLAQWSKVKKQYEAPQRPAQTPQKPAISTQIIEGITMVSIPGGSFRMGEIQGGGGTDEHPVHAVSLSAFEMSATEITVGQFREFVSATGYRTEAESGDGAYIRTGSKLEKKSDANWKNPYINQTDSHPVVCVSWNDAQKYCDWLNQKTGSTFSLPTEAEWEYACRGGTETKYYTGNSESDLARAGWYGYDSGNAEKKTHPVGEKEANAYGLYDMHGNVWEWCSDWYGSYPSESANNPIGANSGSSRVIRGGSWSHDANYCRSAYRGLLDPDYRGYRMGFRVVSR